MRSEQVTGVDPVRDAGGPPPAEVVLAVDVGTTAVKVVALGLERPWRHLVEREYPLEQPRPGWQVQEPHVVLHACVEALRRCVTDLGDTTRPVGLALCTAMHGLVGSDGDGRPTTSLLTWADSRATQDAAALRGTPEGRRLHQETGTPIHPMSPLTKLLWLRRAEPALVDATSRWLDLKALLVARLTGRPLTEVSSASASGLLDRRSLTWHAGALDLVGLGAHQLPEVGDPTDTVGLAPQVARATGLPVGLPVVLGAADGPLGNLGTDAMGPDRPGLSIGTSGALRMVVRDQPEVLDPAMFCYALTRQESVVGAAVSNGGVVLRWAGELLTPGVDDDDALMAMAADVPAGADGLVVLPYLLAERAPWWDPGVPGAVLGLARRHTRGHLVRAAVEGVARQIAVLLERIEAVHPVTALRATGGTLRSPLWRRAVADATGRPLEVLGATEGTAVGAAAVGLVGLGLADDVRSARALLVDPATDVPEVQEPDREGVRAARESRQHLGRLLDALAPVRDLALGSTGATEASDVASTDQS